MDKLCVICKFNTIWQQGSNYCWYCVNNNQILINQYYSRLDYGKE